MYYVIYIFEMAGMVSSQIIIQAYVLTTASPATLHFTALLFSMSSSW